MGSQQLIMVILSMVVVSVAIIIAITMFQANAIESNRSALIDDLINLAGIARSYYWKPANIGGGNRSFVGITIRMLTTRPENENGRYFIVDNSNVTKLMIGGKGKMVVDADTIEIHMLINEEQNKIEIIK